MMDSKTFDIYSAYYDLLYRDKDYEQEAKYVFDTLKQYLPSVKTVLEIGMGTGKHASLLNTYGLIVEGVELSESMAQIASGKGLTCTVGNAIDFSLNKKFNAAISLFHVISYLNSNEDVVRAMHNIHDHLETGGIFAFDVWYTPAVYNFKPEVRVKRLSNERFEILRIAEPDIHYDKNIVDVNYNIFVHDLQSLQTKNFQEKHSMRHFSVPELELLAKLTDFDVIAVEEWVTRNAPSENTWGISNIWRKK